MRRKKSIPEGKRALRSSYLKLNLFFVNHTDRSMHHTLLYVSVADLLHSVFLWTLV